MGPTRQGPLIPICSQGQAQGSVNGNVLLVRIQRRQEALERLGNASAARGLAATESLCHSLFDFHG